MVVMKFVAFIGIVLQLSGAIMFWNLENYFDPFDDPVTADEEFTPAGRKHWTWNHFAQKRNGIAKVILAAGDAVGEACEPPEIVCFAEVENYMVIHQLVSETPLEKLDYGIVHRNSPDSRGIDVALIFRKSHVRILTVDSLRVASDSPTRDILYVKCLCHANPNADYLTSGKLDNDPNARQLFDTLHLFVNHWPSKRGGAAVSGLRRQAAAAVLLHAVDSILAISPSANVIVTGDFNDTPDNVAPLLCRTDSSGGGNCGLRPVRATFPPGIGGTLKYRGQWEQIDQFYISASRNDSLGTASSVGDLPMSANAGFRALVFAPEFLLEADTQFTGVRPHRTYLGPRWHGGLSDHLPILLLP